MNHWQPMTEQIAFLFGFRYERAWGRPREQSMAYYGAEGVRYERWSYT